MKEANWHHYDQNLFCRLAKYSTEKEAEKFAETLGKELGTDLFSVGFKSVHTPSMFLEAIGLNTFPSAKKSLIEIKLPKIVLETKNNHSLIQGLPKRVAEEYLSIFELLPEIAPEELVKIGIHQIPKMPNFVVSELTKAIIQHPLEDLQRNKAYHKTICSHLAIDHALQFPYDELLPHFFSNKNKRREILRQLYHGMFQGAAEAIKESLNCSYFRAFDRFLNKASDYARNIDRNYKDFYRQGQAYLKNTGDLQDPYFIHFSVCGFNYANQQHQVQSFTLDPPNRVKLRLGYAKWLLNWINDNMGNPFFLKPGLVYCFNNALEIVDVFSVEEVALQ